MYKIYFLNKIDESAINVIAVKSMPESFDNFKNYIFGRFPPLMGQPMKFYYKGMCGHFVFISAMQLILKRISYKKYLIFARFITKFTF